LANNLFARRTDYSYGDKNYKKKMMTGKQLKKWREEKGWKIPWLANLLGISRSHLWEIELREEVPRCIALACSAIHYSVPVLFDTPASS
jgi:DNA-binding transcriptional regulator YiaG